MRGEKGDLGSSWTWEVRAGSGPGELLLLSLRLPEDGQCGHASYPRVRRSRCTSASTAMLRSCIFP